MPGILDLVATLPRREAPVGELLMEQGCPASSMLILIEGEVEVLHDQIRVARTGEPGAVFGEMSVLLRRHCTASVRTLKPSVFAVVDQPERFLRESSEASLHVAVLLARRLEALNRYLVDVKTQYEGHDHLGMVDDVLNTLLHQQPRSPAR
jgi:CRP/FNR family cyclic AMP-dependent transcriptional regulator